jgi:23S rRNA pseudouridine2605 synthase
LDLNSTGVLILTNDGDLAARLLHPRHHVEKEYLVTVGGRVSAEALDELRRGVSIEDGQTAPAQVRVVADSRSGGGAATKLLITIHEGKKRQVRRMLEAVGHRVTALHRTSFAGLTSTGLDPGQARRLTEAEIDHLWKSAGRQ